jgi:hypothetical protein
MTDSVRIIVRTPMPEDLNFILATWLKGNYFGNSNSKKIAPEKYYQEEAERITGLLALPGIDVSIACDESKPEWIAGFSVTHSGTIHWIYIRKYFRKQGIAKLLLKDKDIKSFSAITKIGKAIAEKKGLNFRPY